MVKYGVWISKKLVGAVFAVLIALILNTISVTGSMTGPHSGIAAYAFVQEEQAAEAIENAAANTGVPSDLEALNNELQDVVQNTDAAIQDIEAQAETALSTQAPNQARSGEDSANTQVPADVVPPYSQNYRGPNIQPLFKLSQTTTWIIFILLSLLAILLFTWFLIKRVKEATAIRKNQTESIFQANDDTYRFDDDEIDYNKKTEAEEFKADHLLDDSLSHETDEASVVILKEEYEDTNETATNDEGDQHQERSDEDQSIDDPDHQKNGFLTRLFSGNRERAGDDTDPIFVDAEFSDDDHDENNLENSEHDHSETVSQNHDQVIDVDPEPVTDDGGELEPVYINEDEISDDSYFPQSELPVPDVADDFSSDLEREFTTEADLSITQSDTPGFHPQHIITAPMPEIDHKHEGNSAVPPEIIKTLETLEIKQAESSQTINTLAQQLAEQQEGVKSEISAIRTETSQIQSQISKNLDTKFAAFSTNVKSEIQRNEEKIALKNSQGHEMNNEELKLKLLELDKKVINQSKVTELNFHRVMQKLESISAPTPQLTKLADDTSELKSQLSLLQQVTQEQRSAQEPISSPQALKEREINNEILRKLDASLNEQGRNLNDFREENRALASKFDRLNDRIDRMETDLQSQRSSLIEVLERYNHKQEDVKTYTPSEPVTVEKPEASQINPLGIINPTEIEQEGTIQALQNSPYEDASDMTSAQSNNTEADLFSVHQDNNGTEEPENNKPEITPVLFSIDEPQKPIPSLHEYSEPKPDKPQETDRTIRPLTFNMSTMGKGHTNR